MGILSNLSLFSGAGGLDLGARLVGGFRTIGYVEYDAYAQGVLMSRMREGTLDTAPIWDDVRTFDGKPLAGLVDVVSGGFPCQDVSQAGKRGGVVEGNRSGLWFQFARIIREIRPRFVLAENVGGLLSIDNGGGGSELFFESWPRSGTMRNGSCFLLLRQEPLTDESESGLWPTPSASQARSEGMIFQMRAKVEAGEITREEAERMIGGSLTPARMTKFPTPRTRSPRGGSGSKKMTEKLLSDGVITKEEQRHMHGGGQLNPTWVEWLMGWPLEWTVLDVLATAWFRNKASRRGRRSKT